MPTTKKPREVSRLVESPEGTMAIPPLLDFIRAVKRHDKQYRTGHYAAFRLALEPIYGKPVTNVYLYQMTNKEVPNPTLRLAKAIVEQTRIIGPKVGVRALSYDDLLIGRKKPAFKSAAK